MLAKNSICRIAGQLLVAQGFPAAQSQASRPSDVHRETRIAPANVSSRRCVITYSTPDGFYPFCTINCGPSYRPYVEEMNARPLEG
jgi:peroxiredoxin